MPQSESYEHCPIDLQGKTAVVIGGTSGIGEAMALGFAHEGADVVATSRSEEHVTTTAREIRDCGVDTLEVTTDVSEMDSVKSTCDAIYEEFGGVDVLVNSAGTAARSTISDLEEAEWERVVDIVQTGVYRACKVFGHRMETGSIINISSIAAEQGRETLGAYCAAKSAVNAFTRVAAQEFSPDVRVNGIAPGFVITPLTESTYPEGSRKRERINERSATGRVARREEMVGIALYFGSDAASYTTGEIIRIDGGFVDGAL